MRDGGEDRPVPELHRGFVRPAFTVGVSPRIVQRGHHDLAPIIALGIVQPPTAVIRFAIAEAERQARGRERATVGLAVHDFAAKSQVTHRVGVHIRKTPNG